MLVNIINEFLEKENKSLEEGFKYLMKSEFAQLSGFSFNRQFLTDREISSGELRFSSAGKCVRALAYDFHGFEKNGKEIDARGLRTFFIGDMTETMIVLLAKASGVPIFGYGLQQPKVSIKINHSYTKERNETSPWETAEIFGHPDGFIIHEQGIYSLEVKSMNTLGYQRFEAGEIDEAHLLQMNANMKASGTEGCLYVAFNKDTSVLGERLIPRSEALISQVEAKFKQVLESTKENLPERPYEPNEKGFLPWQCLYCSFHKECWPKAEKVLAGKAYKLKVPIDRVKEAEETLAYQQHGMEEL